MNAQVVYTTVVSIGTVIFGFLSMYLKTKNKLKDKVNQGIADAELVYSDTTKAGGKKFNYVVEFLYQYIPAVLKPIFPISLVSQIVQSAFDEIEKYATHQLDTYIDKITAEKSDKKEDK